MEFFNNVYSKVLHTAIFFFLFFWDGVLHGMRFCIADGVPKISSILKELHMTYLLHYHGILHKINFFKGANDARRAGDGLWNADPQWFQQSTSSYFQK